MDDWAVPNVLAVKVWEFKFCWKTENNAMGQIYCIEPFRVKLIELKCEIKLNNY